MLDRFAEKILMRTFFRKKVWEGNWLPLCPLPQDPQLYVCSYKRFIPVYPQTEMTVTYMQSLSCNMIGGRVASCPLIINRRVHLTLFDPIMMHQL